MNYRVKLGVNRKTDSKVALKFFKVDDGFDEDKIKKMFKNEVKVMKKMDHPNIVKILDYKYKEKVPDKVGYNISYLVLELAENGSIFNHIAEKGRFKEKIARLYFRQLVSALEHIHAQGYAHRDVKLENLLLDENFNLKLGDFGLTSKSKTSNSRKGTLAYMAPEILEGEKYETTEADIYSAAISLFMMMTQNCPYQKAQASDKTFVQVATGKWADFWNTHSRLCGSERVFSENFKDLFSKMISVNRAERLTLQQIRAHKWFNGPLPTPEELDRFFNKTVRTVDISSQDNSGGCKSPSKS